MQIKTGGVQKINKCKAIVGWIKNIYSIYKMRLG